MALAHTSHSGRCGMFLDRSQGDHRGQDQRPTQEARGRQPFVEDHCGEQAAVNGSTRVATVAAEPEVVRSPAYSSP